MWGEKISIRERMTKSTKIIISGELSGMKDEAILHEMT